MITIEGVTISLADSIETCMENVSEALTKFLVSLGTLLIYLLVIAQYISVCNCLMRFLEDNLYII